MFFIAALRISKKWMQNPSMKYFTTTCYLSRLHPATILSDVFGGKKRNSTSKACFRQNDSKQDVQKQNLSWVLKI